MLNKTKQNRGTTKWVVIKLYQPLNSSSGVSRAKWVVEKMRFSLLSGYCEWNNVMK